METDAAGEGASILIEGAAALSQDGFEIGQGLEIAVDERLID